MAILDDLISSGLSLAQAQQVVLEDSTSNNVDGLVTAGFTYTQALAMNDYDNNGKTAAQLNNMTVQGIWFGPAQTAIKAALDVTP
jgi:phosphoribosylpyrophosphate synthetase